MDNYDKLVDRISNSASVEKEEIERKVEAKRAKLSGLVSREGAAQIVAAELGVNLDQEKLKISELVEGMRRANFIGKVLELYPIREFNKNGREGKVASFLVGDETSNTRVVLWDTNHIDLIEQGKIKKDDVIEVSNGGVRVNEVHLGSFSDVKLSKEVLDKVVEGKTYGEIYLDKLKVGQSAKVRAFVVQSFEPRYFEVNKKTGRKPTDEEKSAGEELEKRALLNIVLDDGTETIRAVIFGNEIEKLGLTNEEIFNLEKFEGKKKHVLGAEKIFQGNVRNNDFTNSMELSIESIGDVNPEELVKELEAKS
tara:strand:+ start:1209 stop:2138 length:930 start_codon:yes stop_codon:yes gene_type:complete